MDIYSTYYMLAAVEELPLEHTFFRNRYFPTDNAMDVFGTSKVLADFREGTQKRAPFVIPRLGALPVGRDGFSTYELEPTNISVSIPLTIDQITKRGFGESLMSTATPAERARRLLMGDLATLSAMISRTEELLAVQTMLENGAIMRHQTENPEIYENVGVHFFEGNNNPALFTPAAAWTHSTKASETWTIGSWYADMCAMIEQLVKKGRPVREIVVSPDIADFLLADGWVQSILDNRRMEMGHIEPSALDEFTYELGVLNFKGRRLPILVNSGTYENDSGVDTAFLPTGTVIATAPGCGRGLYGAHTRMTEAGQWETIAGKRIPDHIFTRRPPANEVELTARPLFVPNRANPWCVAKGITLS